MKIYFNEFCRKTILLLYFSLFSIVTVSVIFRNYSENYSIFLQLTLVLMEFLLACCFLNFYRKNRESVLKHRYRLLAAAVMFVFAIQTYVTFNMVQNPLYDHGFVYYGRVEYSQFGVSEAFERYSGYIHRYTNQKGLLLILRFIFKAVIPLGITNFYTVSAFVGHILFAVMIICTFLYIEEIANSDRAVFSLLFYISFLPVYFQSSISYTDTYSIWGIPVFLLLTTKAVKSQNLICKIALASLAGLATGLCMQIKVTVFIAVIALILNLIFIQKTSLKNIAVVLSVLLCIFISYSSFNKYAYSTVMEEYRSSENLPITHWIMMGLQGNGSYSSHDEWNISGTARGQDRIDLNIRVIKERLAEMGPFGYIRLLYRKTCCSFGFNDYEMHYNFKYDKESDIVASPIYELIYENGKYYNVYNSVSYSVYLFINLIGLTGRAVIGLKKESDKIHNCTPYISLIGFWMFMMLWESNHRQMVNQWSVYFTAGALGLYAIWQYMESKNLFTKKHNKN